MEITAKMLKELRDMTGCGMLDSKKALEASNGNFDDAIEFFCLAGDSKESAVAAAYYAGFADGRRSIRRKKRKKAISSSSAEPETQDSCAE